MAPSKLVQTPHPRKPRIVKLVASSDAKLLHPCPRCERPVFFCWLGLVPAGAMNDHAGRVAVHVLEQRRGRIAIQTTLGSDDLVAVDVSKSARTFYSLHRCKKAARS